MACCAFQSLQHREEQPTSLVSLKRSDGDLILFLHYQVRTTDLKGYATTTEFTNAVIDNLGHAS